MEKIKPGMIFIAADGDGIGKLVGRAVIANDVDELHKVSNRIDAAQDFILHWCKSVDGIKISGGGDEFTAAIPMEAKESLGTLRESIEKSFGYTISVGVGRNLSEAGTALLVAKLRGKDRIVWFNKKIKEDIKKAKRRVREGRASQEEYKLSEAYLKKSEQSECPLHKSFEDAKPVAAEIVHSKPGDISEHGKAKGTLHERLQDKPGYGAGEKANKIIGKTPSGKNIHAHHGHPNHAGFTQEDHAYSAGLHAGHIDRMAEQEKKVKRNKKKEFYDAMDSHVHNRAGHTGKAAEHNKDYKLGQPIPKKPEEFEQGRKAGKEEKESPYIKAEDMAKAEDMKCDLHKKESPIYSSSHVANHINGSLDEHDPSEEAHHDVIENHVKQHPNWELKRMPISKLTGYHGTSHAKDDASIRDKTDRFKEMSGEGPPVVGVPHPTKPGKYHLIDGKHRHLANVESGVTHMDVYVPKKTDTKKQLTKSEENTCDLHKGHEKGVHEPLFAPAKATTRGIKSGQGMSSMGYNVRNPRPGMVDPKEKAKKTLKQLKGMKSPDLGKKEHTCGLHKHEEGFHNGAADEEGKGFQHPDQEDNRTDDCAYCQDLDAQENADGTAGMHDCDACREYDQDNQITGNIDMDNCPYCEESSAEEDACPYCEDDNALDNSNPDGCEMCDEYNAAQGTKDLENITEGQEDPQNFQDVDHICNCPNCPKHDATALGVQDTAAQRPDQCPQCQEMYQDAVEEEPGQTAQEDPNMQGHETAEEVLDLLDQKPGEGGQTPETEAKKIDNTELPQGDEMEDGASITENFGDKQKANVSDPEKDMQNSDHECNCPDCPGSQQEESPIDRMASPDYQGTQGDADQMAQEQSPEMGQDPMQSGQDPMADDGQDEPDMAGVLQGGLDEHAQEQKKAQVLDMVGQTLAGFKANKASLEATKEQNQPLYNSCIQMLKSMIELCKLLGLEPQMNSDSPQDPGAVAEATQSDAPDGPKQAAPGGAAQDPKAQTGAAQ